MTPAGGLGVRVVPGDDEVVGVGQPIAVKFTEPVANRAAVEERLLVTTSVPVEGSWRWMSDTEAHWRPMDYWPANTEVWFDADLNGVDAGNGFIGNVHRTAHFRIGASHVSIANAQSHTLTVYENGAVIKTFPMSAGQAGVPDDERQAHRARQGVEGRHGLPHERHPARVAPTATSRRCCGTRRSPRPVSTCTRRPGRSDSQGSNNVSHGCINLSESNAEWFYNWSQRGDIVEVTGTPRPPNEDIAMVDWKVPYDQWVQGSALWDPTARTAPRSPAQLSRGSGGAGDQHHGGERGQRNAGRELDADAFR